MEVIVPQRVDLVPEEEGWAVFSPAPPFLDVACPLASQCRDWRYEAQYRKAMHLRAMEREARLKEVARDLGMELSRLQEENQAIKAKLALRDKLLFAASSEKVVEKSPDTGGNADAAATNLPGRKRGQQPGGKGHGRRSYEDLLEVIEEIDLPSEKKECPRCGLAFALFPGEEESEQIEIDVKAYRRVYRRKRYRRLCQCPGTPGIITAPLPPAVIPKSRFGVSIWVSALLDKFEFLRPTYRLVKDFESHDLAISQATITEGFRRLGPLFEPIYYALRDKSLEEDHWHADETGWLVFEKIAGKEGWRWYLWVFRSPSAAVYILDPSRSSSVPEAFFGEQGSGILSADRYSAYKVLIKEGRILIAFCWAHVRRDFLRLGEGYPQHATWSTEWVDRIGKLYEKNKNRLSVAGNGEECSRATKDLSQHLDKMKEVRDEELMQVPPKEKKKVLKSLVNHWDGLTLFLAFPEIPLDNNEAERRLRPTVVGRKNYYGSYSVWSGRMAAMMFSIFQTLSIWGIQPRLWLTNYLTACAERRGQPPEDPSRFLPWNLSQEERQALSVNARRLNSS